MAETHAQPAALALPTSPVDLPVKFEKSNFFRVVHADGAVGGLQLTGRQIAISFYSERRPIPKEMVMTLGPDGAQATKGTPNVLPGVFREVEVCAVMDIPVAYAVHVWLGDRLKEWESVQKATQEAQSGDKH